MLLRSGPRSPTRWSWPTNSSSDRGRILAASGWRSGGGWNSASGRASLDRPGIAASLGLGFSLNPASRPTSAPPQSKTPWPRWLLRSVGSEENRHVAARQLRSKLGTRLSEQLAVHDRNRCQHVVEQVAEIRGVLHRGLGVPVPLDDHAFGLIVVEEQVVLEGAGVLRLHDRIGLLGQAQVLLALALAKLESCDTKKLTHGTASRFALSSPRSARCSGSSGRRSSGHIAI